MELVICKCVGFMMVCVLVFGVVVVFGLVRGGFCIWYFRLFLVGGYFYLVCYFGYVLFVLVGFNGWLLDVIFDRLVGLWFWWGDWDWLLLEVLLYCFDVGCVWVSGFWVWMFGVCLCFCLFRVRLVICCFIWFVCLLQ